jgi:pilus assembly protein Flp/PilA
MTLIRTILKRSDDRGASAVEYGLLIAGIAALIVIAVFALGPIVDEIFDDTCTQITTESDTIDATCNP